MRYSACISFYIVKAEREMYGQTTLYREKKEKENGMRSHKVFFVRQKRNRVTQSMISHIYSEKGNVRRKRSDYAVRGKEGKKNTERRSHKIFFSVRQKRNRVAQRLISHIYSEKGNVRRKRSDYAIRGKRAVKKKTGSGQRFFFS